MNFSDTIAAVSTPYGKGGIAVIRISGDRAFAVSDKVFRLSGEKSLSSAELCRCVYGAIFDPRSGEQIDDGMAVRFAAPRSFTGEDTVEISCHGGILVTEKVLASVLLAGARMAEAGEFTRRAYINGKMSLSSAEALGNLLDAETDEQVRIARSGMRGILTDKTEQIYESLAAVLSAVYAKIDYPDEDLAEISRDEMLEKIDQSIEELTKLCETYRTGHAIAEGINTVIVGRTNAGKSSIYNRIVGRDAAIVTDIEGTTRDVLSERASLGRVLIRISDTAGIRESDDPVERIGIERARKALSEAELVLAVFDGSQSPEDEDILLAEQIRASGKVAIAVVNKNDVAACRDIERVEKMFEYTVHVSAQTGEGIDKLASLVEKIYVDDTLNTGEDAMIVNARQSAAVSGARDILVEARAEIENDAPLEICCSQIESAMATVGELDGRTVSEDIVSRIFSKFCVGK